MSVKVVRSANLSKLAASANNTKTTVVKAGFFEAAKYPDGISVVDVAIQNEYGDSSKNIPPRPFMAQTFDKNQDKWLNMVNKAIIAQTKAQNLDYSKIGNMLGLVMQGDIRDTIVNGNFVPNSPYTIAKKGKDTVLRDSLVMMNAVNYQVVKK